MYSFMKKLCFTALIIAVPVLAAAADAVPPAAPAQPAAVETPQKVDAAVVTENKPSSPAAVQQRAKIGYVDMTRIAEEAQSARELQDSLKQRKDKLQTRIDAKRKQLDKLRAALEAKLPTLAPAQREAKYREFQKKVEEFQKMGRESEEELAKFQEKGAKALYEEIGQAAGVYGKANGFDAIVIKKELFYLGSGVDAQDVTDPLIKALKGTAQKK